MRAIVKILMLFDYFMSFFEVMTPKVLKFLMVYKVLGMLFLSAAKACLANAFSCFRMSRKHNKNTENPNAFLIIL